MGLSIEDLYQVEGTILLLGETGCGKSYWAQQIHARSPLKDHPFLIVNLATLVENLLESELFGHVKGAFTGALQEKKGFVERVGRGTLFLDEIGELTLQGQKKLLFLLEERKYIPVGDGRPREFHGRIMAASNRDLPQLVRKGKFREDLYFRLRVFSHSIGPVRHNPEQVSHFIQYFLDHYRRKQKKWGLRLTAQCEEALMNHPWRGNIREIKHSMEYMVTLGKGAELDLSCLPEWIATAISPYPQERALGARGIFPERLPESYNRALEEFEAQYLGYALKKYRGRINFTSKKIQLSKATLIAKARKYGINTLLLRAQEIP